MKLRPRDITELKDAIRAQHQCEALFVIAIPVSHIVPKRPGWDRVIAVFELVGHPDANRCYAWCVRNGHGKEFVTFLVLPPVDSPRAAVRIWQGRNASSE